MQSFTYAMQHSIVCKWCMASDTQNTTNTLLLVYSCFFAASFLPALSGQLAKKYSLVPACFFPALCDKLATIAFMSGCSTGCGVQMCPLFQRVQYTARHGLPSLKAVLRWDWMRWSEQQQVSIFYWTCQCFIVHCAGTWFFRCETQPHWGSSCT